MHRIMATAVVAVLLGAVVAPAPAGATSPGTTVNLSTAMHDEATAYADYTAWADHATGSGYPELASLLVATANQERGEHFAELASAAWLVGTNTSNVWSSMLAEYTEATNTYPRYATQATADGDVVTSALFTELAGDEASHKSLLAQAYRYLHHMGCAPVPPLPDPVAIVEGPAQATGQTLVNVRAAMRGEAYASAKYRLYADAAYRTGKSWLGNLFVGLSNVELYEHYAALANRYGLVGPVATNLASAIAAEEGAIADYASWSTSATAAGDTAEAALFTEIRGDEIGHRDAFLAMVE